MIRRIIGVGMLLAAACALSSCMGRSDLQAEALARWKAYCASKGKQFLWHDTIYDPGVVIHSVQIEGHCVGPGDRGYVTPAPPDDEP